jgi:hypothetical protein
LIFIRITKYPFATPYFSCLDTRKVTKENQEIPKLAYGSNSGISKKAYAYFLNN